MNRKDLAEMRRRLEEEYDLITCGYDPLDPGEREPGSSATTAASSRESRRYSRSGRNGRAGGL